MSDLPQTSCPCALIEWLALMWLWCKLDKSPVFLRCWTFKSSTCGASNVELSWKSWTCCFDFVLSFLIQIVSTYFGHNSLPWQPTPEADSLSQKWRQIRFFTALKKIKTTSPTFKVAYVELLKVQHLKKTALKNLL